MSEMARFVVQVADERYEVREAPVPDPGPDAAVVRIEACAVCGSDVSVFRGHDDRVVYPIVPGHEPFGIVERIGTEAAVRWGVGEGSRVLVNSSQACGRCAGCRRGRACRFGRTDGRLLNFGYLDPREPPGLWGGFATHLYVPGQVILREIDSSVGVGPASFFNALGNGWHWTSDIGRVAAGETVLVLGPGARGLAAVMVAVDAGAAHIVVVGLPSDAGRLAVARLLGAHELVEAEGTDVLRDRLREVLPDGADLVVDATSGGDVLNAVVPHVARRGRIVLGGIRHGHGPGLDAHSLDRIVLAEIEMLGAASTPINALDQAVRLIESERFPLDAVATHSFALEDAAEAVSSLARSGPDRPVHSRIEP